MRILLAHGSTDHRHGEQIKALADTVSALLDTEVGVAFLSDDVLPKGSTVLPLFIGAGKHVSEDIPKLAAVSDCHMLPCLSEYADQIDRVGQMDRMDRMDRMDQIAALTIENLTRDTRRINAMFVLYRFGGFERLAAALYRRVKICSKHAIVSLYSEPSIESVLAHWQREMVKPIVVQPMLLFEGKSMDRLRAMSEPFDVSIAPVLSEHADFAALIADCLTKESI